MLIFDNYYSLRFKINACSSVIRLSSNEATECNFIDTFHVAYTSFLIGEGRSVDKI